MLVQGKHYLSIWLNENDIVQIIDQTVLPHQFQILNLETIDDVCHAIKSMQIRGAGLIGVTAAYGVYISVKTMPKSLEKQEQWQAWMQECTAKLLATRPTAKNLAWALDEQYTNWHNQSYKDALLHTKKMAIKIAHDDIAYAKSIGEFGKEIIAKIAQEKNNAVVNILTHCNAGWLAFTDYGSALSPIYAAHKAGINVHVWVDETRPRNQGASLTAWELSEQGIEHHLIADNTGGYLMQEGLVDLVIVGADRVTRCGDVANKIGTYLKALAAYDNQIPFYVALPSSTFDFEICDGKQIPIEERDATEVEYMQGLVERTNKIESIRICSASTKARNWAFDVSPARLITGLITERGICKANETDILKLYPEAKKYINT